MILWENKESTETWKSLRRSQSTEGVMKREVQMAKLEHLKACDVSDDGHTDNLSNKEQMLIQLQPWKHTHMWDQLLAVYRLPFTPPKTNV